MKVYCTSDIHTDFPANWEYIKAMPDQKEDILIVCGDISDNPVIIENTLKCLSQKYKAVFFTPEYGPMSEAVKKQAYDDLYKCWGDFRHCKWPCPPDQVAQMFIDHNNQVLSQFKEANKANPPAKVISFSHMLPRRELLPAREHLLRKYLPLVVGYGDEVYEGVRYVQNAFASPQEREGWYELKSLVNTHYMDQD
eukprot:gene4953-5754_t